MRKPPFTKPRNTTEEPSSLAQIYGVSLELKSMTPAELQSPLARYCPFSLIPSITPAPSSSLSSPSIFTL